MLFADKRALETNLKVSLLAIREKELNFYTTNCLAVGTQSALLAGFAYSGLTQVAFPHDAPYFIKLLYMLATTTAMGFELIAVMNTTLLSMVGPGLALRGPDGSMHPAVDGMMIEYRLAFYSFFSGLVSFHLSAALFGWMMFWPDHWIVAVTLTMTICASLYMLLRYATRVYMRFRLPSQEVITGRFTSNEVTPGACSSSLIGSQGGVRGEEVELGSRPERRRSAWRDEASASASASASAVGAR
eukprot:Transcript_6586.p2 GENE.Transcript_6586~~Transcript_6586.p2  ORF type:complete len:244 (-),score=70.26 Transcript_6586:346-1077(-)